MKNLKTDEEVKARILAGGALSEQEILETEVFALITVALIDARKTKKISQKELERLTGIKQQAIARIEKGNANPTLSTISKLLNPLGKKIAVVDA